MDYYLIIMAIIAMGLLAFELISLVGTKGKILVIGRMPSQKITFPILGIIFIYIFVENFGINPYSLGVAIIYVAIFVLATMLKNGMTERGIVVQGIMSKYEKVRYYVVDTQTAKNPRVRMGLGFQEKFIEMSEENANKARALFESKGVVTFSEYKKVRNVAAKEKAKK